MEKIGIIAGLVARPAEQGAYPLAVTTGQTAPRQIPMQATAVETDTPRLSAYSRLWQHKDQTVVELRAAVEQQRRLVQADRLVRELRQQIGGLVKNYPPFPPGSEERMSYLRSISALRQQLEALTVPPAVEYAERLPTPPAMPPASAADAQWRAHAEDLGVYGDALGRLQAAVAESIVRHSLWPEVGEVSVPDTDAGLNAMRQAIEGLRMSTAPLSRQDSLAEAGLS